MPAFYAADDSTKPGDLNQFINQYGVQALLDAYALLDGRDQNYFRTARIDFTGDGVPEFLFAKWGVDVYQCQDGRYVQILDSGPIYLYLWYPPLIRFLSDHNQNGLAEIVLQYPQSQGDSTYEIYEWDGLRFRSLLSSEADRMSPGEQFWVYGGHGYVDYMDEDGDGLLELVGFDQVPLMDTYFFGFPWRTARNFYRWNGERYVLYKTLLAPPEYRFQAVQDGDRATTDGDYDRALNLYRQAIYSDMLGGWSDDLRRFLLDHTSAFIELTVDPNGDPYPPLDPLEYPNLAAYSYLRMLMIHTQRGYITDANGLLAYMQKKFPQGTGGSEYVEMAAIFLDAYQVSGDLSAACGKVIEYAGQHQESVYRYIDVYSLQSLDYRGKPELICPFGQ